MSQRTGVGFFGWLASLFRILFATVVLLIIFMYLLTSDDRELQRQQDIREKEQVLKAQSQAIDYFNKNSTKILNEIRKAIDNSKFKEAVALSSNYLLTENKELIDLNIKATSALNEIEKAEKETRLKKKTQEILAKLKNVTSIYENQKLYQQLVISNPEVKEYKEKLAFYSDKVKEKDAYFKNYFKDAQELKNKAQDNPSLFLKIEKQSWSKEGFGTMANLNLTMKNTSSIDFKDIRIVCRFYAKSGTQLDNIKHTIYEVIKAGSTKKFNGLNLGFIDAQVAKGGCQIIDAAVI